MPNESAASTDQGEQAHPAARHRSTIDYPYLDLENTIEVVRAVTELEQDRCEWNQLAAKLSMAPEGGGFRLRMLSAKTFNVLTYERGQVLLTDLGLRIVDPAHEKRARFDAFLSVALFRQLFERMNGQPLPPVAAIERMAEGLGVSPKQRDRARMTFLRSAKQAGLFDLTSDRLTTPPGLNGAAVRPESSPQQSPEPVVSGGGGGGPGGDLHPFIRGLLQKLPAPEAEWTIEARVKWLTTAANIFGLMYAAPPGDDRSISVEAK